jgi:uncharacterized protein (TIGR00288 family)
LAEENVAVLVDYENVGLESMESLLDQLSDVGRVIIKRAYADWSVHRNKRDQLLEYGIEAAHHFRSTKQSKNSSDISLTIDAIDLLYSAPVDVFVIVSSDSDFVPLVNKLRSAGKSAIGAGRRGGSSPTLVKSCDRYIYLDEPKPAAQAQRRRRRSSEPQAEGLLRRAIDASMDSEGQVGGSKLYQTMQRIDPSFNYKELGHSTFTRFLESCKTVIVERPADGGDTIVSFSNARSQGVNGGRPQRPQVSDGGGTARAQASDGGGAARAQAAGGDRAQRPRSTGGGGKPRAQAEDGDKSQRPLAKEIVLEIRAKSEDDDKSQRPQTEDDGETPRQSDPKWDINIDEAWTNRERDRISGQAAASDAAKVLGATKLSVSEYPSLASLLAASDYLSARWRREGNAIFRK